MLVGTKFGLFMPGLRPTKGIDARSPDDPRDLQVRSRRRVDLERLREFLPELGPTIVLKGHDYQFRAYCTREQWGEALRRIALDIDYEKFKDSPKKIGDQKLVSAYMRTWSAILDVFPEGSIYGNYRAANTARRTTTVVTTEEDIGPRVRFADLTDAQLARVTGDRVDRRLWDEREPEVWELEAIEDEHKGALWTMSEEQRKASAWLDHEHADCTHADTRSARKRCVRKRRKNRK